MFNYTPVLVYIVGVWYVLENILRTLAAFLGGMTLAHGGHMHHIGAGRNIWQGFLVLTVLHQQQLYSIYPMGRLADGSLGPLPTMNSP